MARDEYVRATEAAAMLRVSAKTVSRWAKEGRLSHITTLGGHRRYSRREVETLADALTRGPVAWTRTEVEPEAAPTP